MRILGDAVEGNTIKGVGEYFGGKEGPSKFEWLREQKENGSAFFFHFIHTTLTNHTLTSEVCSLMVW